MKALLREHLSAHRFAQRPEVAAATEALGLPTAGVPTWGIAPVLVQDRIYTPAVDGSTALLLPYFAYNDDRPELDDLVAVGLNSRRVATRRGRAHALGEHWIEAAFIE